MVFSSTVFLFLFLPIILGIYYSPWVRKSRQGKNACLLVSSLVFYAWGEPLFVFLMMFSILVTWLLGILIDSGNNNSRNTKRWIVLGVLYHVGILFVFKYLSFASKEFMRICGLGESKINIALPIGISFFTFQMLSYLIDVYRRTAKVQRNFWNLALYVSLFPQLIAGPIVRYETIEWEIENRNETAQDIHVGLRRFMLGLGKKALLADYLAVIADQVFYKSGIGEIGCVTAWMGAIAYTLEIYFDFSGYSDMAIGLGRCFGFHFKENFDHPYIATSINDFWKRWHISLTDWFRDYVYIPLGGNRVSVKRHILNVVIIWTLTGIWHGANWTFLLWGIIYCILQLLEKYCIHPKRWKRFFSHAYTLFFVCICWVIFRADNAGLAFKYLADMFGHAGLFDSDSRWMFENGIVTILLGMICSLPLIDWINRKMKTNGMLVVKEVMSSVLMIFILLLAVMFSISSGYSPFIYFNF